MPWNQVISKFKAGNLHSGSKSGPKVKNFKQALAIESSEKSKASAGDEEYQPSPLKSLDRSANPSSLLGKKKMNVGPSLSFRRKFGM